MFQIEEAYVCIYSERHADIILFHHEGGVDIGDVDAKALRLSVPVGSSLSLDDVQEKLVVGMPENKHKLVPSPSTYCW